jgi:hypothetical protein
VGLIEPVRLSAASAERLEAILHTCGDRT